jgi:hypothetical protein
VVQINYLKNDFFFLVILHQSEMTFSGGYEMSSPSRAKKKVNEKDEEEKS